jgi:nucleosome binding factor SPN SPT16 subunit
MADVAIDGDLFFSRLQRLLTDWDTNKALDVWGDNADVVCIPMGSSKDQDAIYSKSSAMHLFLLGYEFPESLLILTKNSLYFIATAKKIAYVEAIRSDTKFPLKFIQKTKDDAVNRENFKSILEEIRPSASVPLKMGTILKAQFEGKFIHSWLEVLKEEGVVTTEISKGLGLFLSIKGTDELDTCKRAAVLTNKVMKHGFVKDMEEIIDQEKSITHEDFAQLVEEKIFDPNKIGVKVSKDVVECCYTPIIQSGGHYDIRPSAMSDSNTLKYDIIICSLGARYRNYCGNISRTYMVDVPQRVVKVYAILISLMDTCLEQMTIGKPLNSVLLGARAFLERKDPSLVACLPKSLGFAIGLEFRDGTMVLNSNNENVFEEGMVFNLSVGLSNVPMDDGSGKKIPEAMQALKNFSLLISDTVAVQKEGVPDVLTKLSKAFSDVHYNIGGDEDEEEEEEDTKSRKDKAIAEALQEDDGQRRSARFKEEKAVSENAAIVRATRQHELMEQKIAEKQRKALKKGGADDEEDEEKEAVDLKSYPSTEHFPADSNPKKLRVDMKNEAVLVPISGQLVPFHISTIKNVSMPEPDKATYLRINFFAAGMALGKDCPKNVSRLIAKYGDYSTFVKELTFRSLDARNLTLAYRSILELRKRVRQREQKEEEEKDLVQQAKLIRIRDERVPRLQDLTMRPTMSGRKCSGSLEAHQNGLRFVSTRGEVMDVMYTNIKHALYQPCQNSTMVVIHFHLKDFVLIGKKKYKDIQFYTEVVESFINLDNHRRSAYDPDELDDEQKERQMKKTLNKAFADFCKKVEKVAKHFKFPLEFDSPYLEFSFYGTCHKEMVLIQPSVYCLVNLTEIPNFCLSISDVEHVHFERVNFATKNFDMVLIFKNFDIPPQSITAIEMKNLEMIQDWLNEVQVTYTAGSMSVNWKVFLEAAKNDPRFYFDTTEDGERKPVGWFELTEDPDAGGSDEESEEGESSYDESGDGSESESDSDSDDSEESFEDEDSEGSYDEEAEDDLEEEGMDWDEMHEHAAKSDRKRETRDEDQDDSRREARPPKKRR